MTTLKGPMFISSRLMAAVNVGGAEINVGPTGRTEPHYGKPVWAWTIELDNGKVFDGSDLAGWGDHNAMMGSLLCFLEAFAEARGEDSDNWGLFPDGLRDWARANSDEIGMTRCEIEGE